jgi:hypothetical protein
MGELLIMSDGPHQICKNQLTKTPLRLEKPTFKFWLSFRMLIELAWVRGLQVVVTELDIDHVM